MDIYISLGAPNFTLFRFVLDLFFYLFISFFLRFRYPRGFSNPCFFFYIRFLTKEKSSYCEKYLSFAWTHPNFSTEISLLFETVYTRKFITFTLFLVRLIIFRFQLSFILLPVHSYFPHEQNFYNLQKPLSLIIYSTL